MLLADNENTFTGGTMPTQKMYQLAALVGVGFAAPTIIYLLFLPDPLYGLHLAIFLSTIAGVYLGFSIADGRVRNIILESTVIAIFVALSIIGLNYSLLILAFGYFAHGVWDCVHHPNLVTTQVAVWYPPFCAVYDWSITTFVLIYYYL